MSPYTPEHARDEEIIASILAGAAASSSHLVAGGSFFSSSPSGDPAKSSQCCAIGAGILFHECDRKTLSNVGGIQAFAERYAVSPSYAAGVSDGFETNSEGVRQASSGYFGGYTDDDPDAEDYERGFAVGAAVREASEIQ